MSIILMNILQKNVSYFLVVIVLVCFRAEAHSGKDCKLLFARNFKIAKLSENIVTTDRIIINNFAKNISTDKINFLNTKVSAAIEYLERVTGESFGPVTVNVGQAKGSNLRIGFVPESNAVNFIETEGVLDLGIMSEDVIFHEIFHALMYQKAPELFTPEMLKSPNGMAIHEAMADYFAYKLDSDKHFGDNFLQGPINFIRENVVDLELGLVEGEHQIGNALSSFMIKYKVDFLKVWQIIKDKKLTMDDILSLSPGMKEAVEKSLKYKIEIAASPPYEIGKLKKVRLKKNVPVELHFTPNDELLKKYPEIKIQWANADGSLPDHFSIIEVDRYKFKIESKGLSKSEKLIAVYTSGDKVIGSQAIYVGDPIKPKNEVENVL